MSTDGLSTPSDVEALADRLSACADQLHMRVQGEAAAIGQLADGSASRARRYATLEKMIDGEQELRQRANGLYADAATAIVTRLGTPQQDVLALTDAAVEKIRQITRLDAAVGLVAGLLALAAGVTGKQPAAVLAALATIRLQVGAVKAR